MTTLKHAALYCRISQDKSGRAESVADQERWGREYAATAWPGQPVTVYADNDISAAKDDQRPGYEALRTAISRREVGHVWAKEQSRLERRDVQWFELAALMTAGGIRELHTRSDGVVPVAGVVAGIKAVLNKFEVQQMTERINDKLDANAAAGRPAGSVPFGYAHAVDGTGAKTYVIVPEQADAIRDAADKVLSGWSLASIAAGLRAQGLTGAHRLKVKDARGDVVTGDDGQPVTRPGRITAGSVRSMLTNPTVAGQRVHRGVITGRGNWPAILDEATWQACRAKLSAPRVVARRPRADGSDGGTYPVTSAHSGYSGRRYTLTGGLLICGVCRAPMVGTVKQLKGGSKRGGRDVAYYLCHPSRGGKACVGIMLAETERDVADRLFRELDKPQFLDAIAEDAHAARRDQITTELSAIDGKRRELAGMWATPGGLTNEEWREAREKLSASERKLRGELAEKGPPPARVNIERARSSWPFMELGEKREFLRLFIERVTITRAVPGRQGFDSGRVGIEWRKR